MKHYSILFLMVGIGLVLTLTSCDLLGIGDDNNNNKRESGVLWMNDKYGASGVSPNPILENKSVYLYGLLDVAKFNVEDGKRIWSAEMPYKQNAGLLGADMILLPNKLIVGNTTRLKALNKEDGSTIWETPIDVPINTENEFTAVPVSMAVSDSQVMLGSADKLFSLNKEDGSTTFELSIDGILSQPNSYSVNKIVADAHTAFSSISHLANGPLDVNGDIVAVDVISGTVNWHVNLQDVVESNTASTMAQDIALTQELLVAVVNDNILAFEKETGNILWKKELNGDNNYGSGQQILATGETFYIYTSRGSIIKLKEGDGAELWSKKLENSAFPSLIPNKVIIDSNHLYITFSQAGSGSIKVVSIASGDIERTIDNPDFEGANSGFDLINNFTVKEPYLVRQGAIYTYGMEL